MSPPMIYDRSLVLALQMRANGAQQSTIRPVMEKVNLKGRPAIHDPVILVRKDLIV